MARTKHTQSKQEPADDFRLERLIERLLQSETGAWLLQVALSAGIRVEFDRQASRMGYFDADSYCIYLSRNFSDDLLVIALAHELRHVWQDINGYLLDLDASAYDNLMIGRLLEADAMALMCRVGWELAAAGDSKPVMAMLRSPMKRLISLYADGCGVDMTAMPVDFPLPRQGAEQKVVDWTLANLNEQYDLDNLMLLKRAYQAEAQHG